MLGLSSDLHDNSISKIKKMFSLVADELSDIEKEFPQSLQEPMSSNLEVFILYY